MIFFQCFDTVLADGKDIWLTRICVTYPQRFCCGTDGERKLRVVADPCLHRKLPLKVRWWSLLLFLAIFEWSPLLL